MVDEVDNKEEPTNESPVRQVLASVNRYAREDIECARSTVKRLVRLDEDATRVGMELRTISTPSHQLLRYITHPRYNRIEEPAIETRLLLRIHHTETHQHSRKRRNSLEEKRHD